MANFQLLTEKRAGELLDLSPGSLQRFRWLRRQKKIKAGPPFITLPSGSIRYDRDALWAWATGQELTVQAAEGVGETEPSATA